MAAIQTFDAIITSYDVIFGEHVKGDNFRHTIYPLNLVVIPFTF